MTDLTKLADDLDGIGSKATSLTPDQRMEIIRAARILRAAAGADVAGLMDVADRYALAQADPAHWRSALESDLRLALVGREWQPIETAPKDGTHVLLSNGFSVAEGWWEHVEPYIREKRDVDGRYIDQDEHDGFDGWLDFIGGMLPEPTHYMPLPAAAPKGTP